MLKLLASALALLLLTSSATAEEFDSQKAWAELEDALITRYVYLHDAGFDAPALLYRTRETAARFTTKESFLNFAQQFVRRFHDPHLNLGPYDPTDYAIIPTGSDMWAVQVGDTFVLEDVKGHGAADKAGIRPGFEVLSIDGLAPRDAIAKVMSTPFDSLSTDQATYALNISLAGIRRQPRTLIFSHQGKQMRCTLPSSYDHPDALAEGPPITSRRHGKVGYIRLENSAGRDDTVAAFEKALDELSDTSGLVIDLRNIPSGGNTSVGRPVLGHFTRSEQVYQIYQTPEGDTPYYKTEPVLDKIKPVAPYYDRPVVVLVGRWTGSMGEGMAVGFDTLGVKAVVGAPMADLLGAVTQVELPTSGGRLELGVGRIYRADMTCREDYVPTEVVIPADRGARGEDPALERALEILGDPNAEEQP